jgi:RNA polymerase sigma-70 factor (ECF subfamily)
VVVPLFGQAALEGRTDDELARLTKEGQPQAFDHLVRRHQSSALQLAWKYLGDLSLARDACQAAFLEVFRGLESYQPKERFVFWLRRIVLNQCRMAARASSIRTKATQALTQEPEPAVERPDDWLLVQERRKAVEAAMGKLTDKLREVAVLRYVAGHSLEEVAAILELPLGTVKSRLFSAVAGLRQSLGGGA